MSPYLVGLICFGCTFGGALLGLALQRRLPSHHLNKESHEIVKLGAGMVATMSALVLGLMVSSAKSSFDAINAGIVQDSAKIILLDRALAKYGPAAAPVRAQLRASVAAALATLWPEDGDRTSLLGDFERAKGLEQVQDQLRALQPETEAQRELLALARQLVNDMAQNRWLVIETAQSQIPPMFLVVLICWLTVLFTSFGLFTPRHATVLAVLAVCALSVSAAIFLVLELNRSLTGIIQAPSGPLREALRQLGR